MSDKLGGNFSVETYITKHENLLMENIRRLLQTETKLVLLESGIQELYKKNEELTQQLEVQRTTSDQSFAGLEAVTIERDKQRVKVAELEKALNDCNNQATGVRNQYNDSSNRILVLEEEIKQLNTKVQVANNDYATLKENYNKVLEALNDANEKLDVADRKKESAETVKPVKTIPKKKKNADSEWVDGEYKVST